MSPKINPGATDGRTVPSPDTADAQQLREELAGVYDLFEQAPGCMVLFVGPEHVVHMANPAYLSFTGLTREIVGRPAREGLKRGYERGMGRILDEVYAGGQPKVLRNARITVTRHPGGPDEEAFADFVLQPLRDPRGQVYGIFLQGHEVTLEKLAADKLRHAQKMEAIGRLTGGIAHDFNNLLAVVIGSAEALADALADDPDLQGLANVALGAAERGADLVARLLAFARSQPLTPQPVDCARFLDGMLPILRRTISSDIEIVVDAPDGLACLADPTQLTSAVLNLAINARDAMPGGGRITLHAAADPADPEVAVIAVSDTGEGMSAETRARALEPFFTTKPEGRGSGLGLAMVQGFVAQSGGRLEIDSEPGRGTCISLRLPLAPEADAAEAAAEAAPVLADPTFDRHVLVVEDDDLLRDQVARLLTAMGCRVTTRRNGHDALRRLGEAPDIDLLMTDMVMPGGMNGRQLADHARLLHPHLKVLYTSGHTDEPITRSLRTDGSTGFLAKPYRRAELARKLAEVCGAA